MEEEKALTLSLNIREIKQLSNELHACMNGSSIGQAIKKECELHEAIRKLPDLKLTIAS
ncbi:hypothetical protein [Faecalibaculum rodentium]|uniref:hypothetical protein n=1 Tax=Faecalibaculum rodentium TaxID=1702221 RepID=UPI0023F47120|nr:hypothetical protein [Faecalibaculum rodentium]